MMDTTVFIGMLRVLYCIPFLFYSCYTDILTRRVSDLVWKVMLVGAIPFVTYDIVYGGMPALSTLLLSAGAMFIFVFILFQIGGFGGADAKCLILISIIIPVYPTFETLGFMFPLNGTPLINHFSFSVFLNSIILIMAIPLFLFLYNLLTLKPREIIKRPLYLFVGLKIDISKLLGRHLKLIEEFYISEGELHTKFRPSGASINHKTVEELEGFVSDGLIDREVWTTPGLPFIIPITIGFFIAVFYGLPILH